MSLFSPFGGICDPFLVPGNACRIGPAYWMLRSTALPSIAFPLLRQALRGKSQCFSRQLWIFSFIRDTSQLCFLQFPPKNPTSSRVLSSDSFLQETLFMWLCVIAPYSCVLLMAFLLVTILQPIFLPARGEGGCFCKWPMPRAPCRVPFK